MTLADLAQLLLCLVTNVRFVLDMQFCWRASRWQCTVISILPCQYRVCS